MRVMINGNEQELPFEEAHRIYCEMERMYIAEDIRSKQEELGKDLSDVEIEKIVSIAQGTLANHETYMECYWDSIEYAINEVENMGHPDRNTENMKILDVVRAAMNLYGASELCVEESDDLIDVVVYERHCDPHPYMNAVARLSKCNPPKLRKELDKLGVHYAL